LRGLRYEREFWMSSAVNLIVTGDVTRNYMQESLIVFGRW